MGQFFIRKNTKAGAGGGGGGRGSFGKSPDFLRDLFVKPSLINFPSILIFVPKIFGGKSKYGYTKTNTNTKHISGMCIKPNIFNFTLIFMQNIWGVDTFSKV